MNKEKLKVPKLRFKEFSGEWEEKKLGEIANIYDGTHQTPTYTESGVKFVSVENINSIETTEKYISEEAFKNDFKVKPQTEDILMTRITAGIIGATAIVKNDNPLGYYVSLALIRKKIMIDTFFLDYSLNTNFFKNELHKRIIHVAFPKKINLGDMNDCVIRYSNDISEQQKIADFLSKVDEKIEKLTRKKKLLEGYKKGFMQKIFSQEIRFKDDNGNDFPEWEEKELGEASEIIMGQSPDSVNYNIEKIGLPLIQGNADCKDRKTAPRNYTSQITKECNVGDIIMTVRAPVGSISISLHHACIGRGVCAIRTENRYIYHYLVYFEEQWATYSQGSTFTAVSSSDIRGLKINLPSLSEQQKIADFLSVLDKKIDIVEKELGQVQKFKKGLLQQMFV